MKHDVRDSIVEYVYVIVGAAIIAIGFNVFLLPNQVASGGVSGISTILHGLFGWNPGIVQYAFNIPLFIAGVLLLGKKFGIKSFIGTITLPFIVLLTNSWEPWTDNPLLGALFGGIIVGLGIGLVFKGNASTGGTDLLAQIITKFTGLSLGTSVLLIDGVIAISAAIVFDLEKGLYALIGLYVTTKTIDIIQLGFSQSKMVYIITLKQDEVREAIYAEINRGVTKLPAIGGYTGEARPVLMVVVYQTEFTKLKQLIKSVDPSAFVIVSDAYEVLGEGFKRA
ncbi:MULTISPECIES: YitT family protein [Lysinibacillus]|uniref:YitT family protein n=1 Tax=Lysinibacillus TaxID=400634 RepID=UPI001C8B4BDD|nr:MULTISPECIES: YitT family protein [Lysinibacillus]WHP41404.1 YitT family protein [Lysinibacillus boronitolerans]MBX8944727.1 YitT family protein [Lysinibacillus sp. K60]UNT56410.1 YitT family protein [Lysinibacillus capsici]UUV23710.1 YitT family protein [Lysinibacillus sp. FN11]UYB46582.1 YitT family protein [Lysinibacillus capsici]